jgi:hypothetical protein
LEVTLTAVGSRPLIPDMETYRGFNALITPICLHVGIAVTETIAGIEIPDSQLAREATELVRDAATPLLYHHSRRVFLFGSLQGHRLGLTADPELLYVGAMFHDLGLTEKYRSTDQRFEIDGADEARRFLAAHGRPEERARPA